MSSCTEPLDGPFASEISILSSSYKRALHLRVTRISSPPLTVFREFKSCPTLIRKIRDEPWGVDVRRVVA